MHPSRAPLKHLDLEKCVLNKYYVCSLATFTNPLDNKQTGDLVM